MERDFNDISASINNLHHDIKAEAIIVDLIESGINPGDIIITPEGSFTRKFRRDISRAEVMRMNNGQEALSIRVTRDGLYDALPEGLFHDQASGQLNTGQEMAKESKKQKAEEKEARKFFLPFENEIFFQRVFLEMEERKILHRFSDNLFDDIYPEFWNFDRGLPHKLTSRLVLLLHFAHKIAGNLDLTAKALEIIIEEPVKVKRIRQQQQDTVSSGHSDDISEFTLGEAGLGIDTLCGHDDDAGIIIEFVIGPLQHSTIDEYLEKGQMTKFLECFYGYFVPVEMDVVTTLEIEKDMQNFVLGEPSSEVILGYNAVI